MEKSSVAVAHCDTYAVEHVGAAIDKAIAALGGLENFIAPDMKVFVKPNLLLAAAPEKACTTHPAVLIELIRRLQDFGAKVSFGDLPGGFHVANTKRVHRETGMERVAGETGAELVALEKHGFKEVEIPEGAVMRLIHIPKYLDGMDAIINVPKIKTHMQSKYTGAVKNLFGLVTTQDRLTAHRHSKYEEFAKALVDIFSAVKPALSIADAVVGMEGTGPSQGRPVKLGFIAASADAVALDTVAATVMGFNPREIGTIEEARKRGLGAGRMRNIDIVGDPIEPLIKNVRKPAGAVFALMPMLSSPMSELTTVKPKIISSKCKKCGTCVEVCPNNAIMTSGKHFEIVDSRCLKCFCCHEMCPHDAVGLKKPILTKLAELLT